MQQYNVSGSHSRSKVQSIDSQRPTPPSNPAPGKWVPRRDRDTIANAFHVLGRSVRWLAKVNDVTEAMIEGIIRDERAHDRAYERGFAAGQKQSLQHRRLVGFKAA